ncbi:11171_t:CDS:2 [Dentiscutata erythropus]|uniref:11171_t:CDS:1 n=1 Tax=Dentiscutata erythropus TaxID=1348616 RepID=A0A9N8VZM8_9GLOM|nr:11171_t:CDS:2 [Dentiscutata erythropus]
MGTCISKIRLNKPLSKPEEIMSTPNNPTNTSNHFRFSSGRRYHNVGNAVYFMPNDDDECDRLHLQHIMERFIWQSAGSWSLEMAANYPKSKFIGIDISPVQSEENKPPNVEFIKANVLERLPFDDNTFDFIFQRFLTGGIPTDKWPSVINELVRILKPGGYLELAENDIYYTSMGPASEKLIESLSILLHERGLDPTACYKIQKYLEENDQLHNVNYEEKKCIEGQDAIRVYKLLGEDYSTAMANMKSVLIHTVKVSNDEYDRLVNEFEKETIELESFPPHIRVHAQKKF